MSSNDLSDLSDLLRMLMSSRMEAASAAHGGGIRCNDYPALSNHICSVQSGNRAMSIKKRENIAQQMIDKSPVIEDAKTFAGRNIQSKKITCDEEQYNCRNIIVNLTDSSAKFAEHVADSGYLELLLEELKISDLNPTKLDPNGNMSEMHDFALSNLTILHNCLWRYEDTADVIEEAAGIDVILHFLRNAKSEKIQMEALMVLADAADPDENPEVLSATEGNIQFILDQGLIPALDKELKDDTHSFGVDEILHCLTSIAKNDSNAKHLVKLGILDILEAILQSRDELEEEAIQACVRLLHQLSLTSEEALRGEQGLIEEVKELTSSQNTEISERSAFILLNVGLTIDGQEIDSDDENRSDSIPSDDNDDDDQNEAGKIGTHPAVGTNAVGKQAMISYCWKQQELALKLRDRLSQRGFNVWIDVEKMEGSILEKMAEAVDGSAAVIMLVSEAYKNSENCRSEAKYARKRAKPRVYALAEAGYDSCGWLGVMMEDEIYYDIATRFDQETEKLIARVRTLLE